MAEARYARSANPDELIVPQSRQFSLSRRQSEVLYLAACGLSGKQIARELRISTRTVQDHFSRLRQRTGARSQAELVATAVAAGFLDVRSLTLEDPSASVAQ